MGSGLTLSCWRLLPGLPAAAREMLRAVMSPEILAGAGGGPVPQALGPTGLQLRVEAWGRREELFLVIHPPCGYGRGSSLLWPPAY